MDFTISIGNDVELKALAKAQQAYGSVAAEMTQAQFVQLLVANQVAGFMNLYVTKNLTNLDFLNRFTQAERIAIRTAAQSNAAVADYLAMQDAASGIDLTDTRTIAGVNALEAAGLIGAGRAAQILAL